MTTVTKNVKRIQTLGVKRNNSECTIRDRAFYGIIYHDCDLMSTAGGPLYVKIDGEIILVGVQAGEGLCENGARCPSGTDWSFAKSNFAVDSRKFITPLTAYLRQYGGR